MLWLYFNAHEQFVELYSYSCGWFFFFLHVLVFNPMRKVWTHYSSWIFTLMYLAILAKFFILWHGLTTNPNQSGFTVWVLLFILWLLTTKYGSWDLHLGNFSWVIISPMYTNPSQGYPFIVEWAGILWKCFAQEYNGPANLGIEAIIKWSRVQHPNH